MGGLWLPEFTSQQYIVLVKRSGLGILVVTWIAGAYNPNYLITKKFKSIEHVFNDTSELSAS